MSESFSKLFIKPDEVKEWIKFWCEENLSSNFEIFPVDKGQRISYKIISDGIEIQLDLIKCSEGRYTISYKVGKRQDLSERLARYILKRMESQKSPSAFANGFSIKSNKETFEAVIELLDETKEASRKEYKRFDEDGKAKYSQYKYESSFGDSIVIKYFDKTKRIQVQGKPLYLFNRIQEILVSDNDTAEGLADANLKYCNIDVDKKDIYDEMKEILGAKLYEFLSRTQKSILSSSFIFSKVDFDSDDYTAVITPALRALEGYIFKLLTSCKVIHNSELLGEYFYYSNEEGRFCLHGTYEKQIENPAKSESIERLYRIYHKRRHPYSHATERDYDTAIIESREKADSIFKEIIDAMKTSYLNW